MTLSAIAVLPPEVVLLNRLGFGPRPGDAARVRQLGLTAYIEEQLHPDASDEAGLRERLARATLRIEYEWEEKTGEQKEKRNVKEDRLLTTLDQPVEALWVLHDEEKTPRYDERRRPFEEVRAATWLRAVHGKWQLRELLVEFWHNHFSVNVGADDAVACTLPVYDRDVIRRHCLGNFRALLEAVARSVAMQYYLNNVTSRASPANENYARELFELHSLGATHYFNNLYKRWRDVPGATQGQPTGYIDQDVYEAARAFTGWTIANGTETSNGKKFPDTGQFHYFEGWHDNYQKRVLATEFDPNAAPLADGQRVLDLVARHPATARHVCYKLCRRLLADEPPPLVLAQAVQVWLATADQPDQLRQVVRSIVTAPELLQLAGQKAKRPFELGVSFLRALDVDLAPSASLDYYTAQMGYSLFEWPTPTGHPDTADFWLGTNSLLGGWNLLNGIMWDENIGIGPRLNLAAQLPASANTPRRVVAYWGRRLLGYELPAGQQAALLTAFAPNGTAPDDTLDLPAADLNNALKNLVVLVAAGPAFQMR